MVLIALAVVSGLDNGIVCQVFQVMTHFAFQKPRKGIHPTYDGNQLGQVIDDFNGPVIGANVIVKGTNVGTITDTEGYFVLETTKNAVLRFSFPGMKAKEVAVKDVQGKLKVQLYSDGSAQGSQSAPPLSSRKRCRFIVFFSLQTESHRHRILHTDLFPFLHTRFPFRHHGYYPG